MNKFTVLTVMAMLISSPAGAYKDRAHEKMTKWAASASSINDRVKDYGLSLGVLSLDSQLEGSDNFYTYRGWITIYRERHSVVEWMQKGAIEEDIPIHRPVAHFYNPLAPKDKEGLFSFFTPSIDWGLGLNGESLQSYSWLKAKDYLYEGIVAPTESERRKNLTLLFQAIGHVVHLVQDLGQPQHTRNDSHLTGMEPSLYEGWTKDNASLLTYDGYPAVKLTSPQKAWTTCSRGDPCMMGSGLANYSNRGFITSDTNFTSSFSGDTLYVGPAPRFPSPNGAGLEIEKLQITNPKMHCPVAAPSLKGESWFIKTPVEDFQNNSTDKNTWISTFSIFDADLAKKKTSMIFNFTSCNAQSIQKLLVPRTVGYSAGLINYFFRGRLEISLPKVGAYAYADHSKATGFSSITATIKNVTPNEHLKGGKLVAVVKFHRNNCYKPDLSGEFTMNGDKLVTPCKDYREAQESRVVSKELAVNLKSNEPGKEFTFEFPAGVEVPMNATDVYLQVVYRGKLGPDDATLDETDGIAVGARDISEPTFFTLSNVTDMFAIPSNSKATLFYWKDIVSNIASPPYSVADWNKNKVYDGPPLDLDVVGGNIAYELSLKGNKIATVPALPEGRFARLALLGEPTEFLIGVKAVGAGFNDFDTIVVPRKLAQQDYDKNTYRVSPVDPHRQKNQFSVFWFYHYYGTPLSDGEDAELPSKEEKGGEPVGMDIQTPSPFELPRFQPDDVEPSDNAASAVSQPPEPAQLVLRTSLQ